VQLIVRPDFMDATLETRFSCPSGMASMGMELGIKKTFEYFHDIPSNIHGKAMSWFSLKNST